MVHAIMKLLLLSLGVLLVAPSAVAEKDYYSILGVSRGADDRQLKKAYRKLAMRWHPDKVKEGDKEKATKKFQEIAKAYETLSDPEKRKLYDLGVEDGAQSAGGQSSASARRSTSNYHTSGYAQSSAGPEIDPTMFEAFRHMCRDGRCEGARSSDENLFGSFFAGMGGMGGLFTQTGVKRSTQKGSSLFAGSAVRELQFDTHLEQIEELQGRGGALVMFYANGGKSCPKACEQMRKPFHDLAIERGEQVPVLAVQCLRRRGKCKDYAESFPTIVLYGRAPSQELVLSRSKVKTTSQLRSSLDQILGSRQRSTHSNAEHRLVELTAKNFGTNPCGGQFCLILFEYGEPQKMQAARKAMAAAAKQLQNDPVTPFYVRESSNPEFVSAFGFQNKNGFLGGRQSARIALYRPLRGRYELYDGNVDDAKALTDFVTRVLNRGSPLPQRVLRKPKVET